MSAPVVQGWCPGALRPMVSGDGLVVRIRLRGGRLVPDECRIVAELARRHGNGVIDLSARANLQLRGVTPASHAPLVEGLRGLGLIDASPEAEARRNIVVTPFRQDGDGAIAIAEELARLLAAPDAPATPGKFGFAVDSGQGASVLGAVSADVRITRHPSGWLVAPDSFVTGAMVGTPQEAAEAAIELARWFVAAGGVAGGRGRMASLWRGDTDETRSGRLPSRFRVCAADAAVRPAVLPGPCPQGWLAALAFGQTTAETFAALAGLGAIRLTPWRMVLIEGLTRAPAIPGLIVDRNDPLLRVIACTGAPGCMQALGATRDLARRLAPGVPPGKLLHVSGCTKGCAHPGPAPATLVAREGGAYDLVLNGTAAAPPARRALSPGALAATDLFPTG